MGTPSLATIVTALLASAGMSWPPEARYAADEGKCPTPLSDATRTVLRLRLDAGLVDRAEEVLGASPVHEEGDAGSYRKWRCWEAANGDGTVLYIAKGEVQGILRIVGPDMAFADRGTCPKSTKIDRHLATANGIGLGTSRAAFQKRIGRISQEGEGWYERACFTQKRLTDQQIHSMNALVSVCRR